MPATDAVVTQDQTAAVSEAQQDSGVDDPHSQHVNNSAVDAQQTDTVDGHAQHSEAAVHDHNADASVNMNMSSNSEAGSQQRDPHAYSNGLKKGLGPYAVNGQELHLADEANFGGFRMNRLEQLYQEGADAAVYDIQAWYGNSYDQLVVKAEGEFSGDKLEESDTDILWSHGVYSFWNTQVGVRHQSGEGPDRNWLAFGVQGIAPYWFEVDATAYLGSSGRSALNIEADYELLITQRLVLQPRVEANFYGEDDRARGLGSGLSDLSVGLRLKYQISRQFVPYIGVEQARMYGDTAKFSVGSKSASQTRWLAGLRFWF